MKASIGLRRGQRFAVYRGDCLEMLSRLESADHVITDPPYDAHVHAKNRRILDDRVQRAARAAKRPRKYRKVGLVPLDFAAITQEQRELAAEQFERFCRRWCLVFTNAEATHLWRKALVATGMEHVRVGAWVKECAQPQLTGDRPGVGFEEIEITHRRQKKRGKGGKINPLWEKMRWNGGGLPAVFSHRIATSNNGEGERFHTTQKPLSLMLELVQLFTEPDDLVVDPFCGSGTTGLACLRLGRRFIGIERDAKYAKIAQERLEAERRGLSLADVRRHQTSIFDVIPMPAPAERVAREA